MNKVILIGNLTRDPEQGKTPAGVDFCRFSLAVQRDFANANGERETDFFNITVWRKQAELCLKYLKKGNKAGIVGTLQNRTYEDKDGVKRTATEVVANEIEFLTPKAKEEDTETQSGVRYRQQEMGLPEKPKAPETTRPHLDLLDDDTELPF